MKKIYTIFLIIALVAGINVSLSYNPPNIKCSYYNNNQIYGQCVWYVYGRLLETGVKESVVRKFANGNAINWYHNAMQLKSEGIVITDKPATGAIAVWKFTDKTTNIDYGHVAFVETPNGYVTESNLAYNNKILVDKNNGKILIVAKKLKCYIKTSENSTIVGTLNRGDLCQFDNMISVNNEVWYKITSPSSGYIRLIGYSQDSKDCDNCNQPLICHNFTGIRIKQSTSYYGNKGGPYYININPLVVNKPQSTIYIKKGGKATLSLDTRLNMTYGNAKYNLSGLPYGVSATEATLSSNESKVPRIDITSMYSLTNVGTKQITLNAYFNGVKQSQSYTIILVVTK